MTHQFSLVLPGAPVEEGPPARRDSLVLVSPTPGAPRRPSVILSPAPPPDEDVVRGNSLRNFQPNLFSEGEQRFDEGSRAGSRLSLSSDKKSSEKSTQNKRVGSKLSLNIEKKESEQHSGSDQASPKVIRQASTFSISKLMTEPSKTDKVMFITAAPWTVWNSVEYLRASQNMPPLIKVFVLRYTAAVQAEVEPTMQVYMEEHCLDSKGLYWRMAKTLLVFLGLVLSLPALSFVPLLLPFPSPDAGFLANWAFNFVAHPLLNYVPSRATLELLWRAFDSVDRQRIRWIVLWVPMTGPCVPW